MKKLNKKGFTLMEMLIVVAIIAILIAIAVPALSKTLTKAEKVKENADAKTEELEETADNYIDDDGNYVGATD